MRHLQQPFDADGRWAAAGTVAPALLAQLLDDPYFSLAPPKSTGRDRFNEAWLDANLKTHKGLSAADVQATLCELTARTLAQACRQAQADAVVVCGGGAYNAHLIARLAALLAPTPVSSSAALGVAPNAVEALAFAWLARERMAERPGNVPAVTGANGPRILGAVYAPPPTDLSA
jgi:anhydro-N-acetylmuramic acid kinase